jgi:hydroxylaminobenzene mutase
MNVQSGGRHILLHGMAFILAGLMWGFAIPATPYPRLALGAHIQFETNGLLFIVLAVLLLKLPHRVGRKSVWVMVLAVWLAWPMVLSEAANAWWGATQILPLAANQAGASGGELWQELVVKLTHALAGMGLIVAWALLILGFMKAPDATILAE